MPTASADSAPPVEQGPRRALAGGAALLALGLAIVGVGAGDAGAVVALVGLLVTIYGIHSFGRLGPDDPVEAAGEGAFAARRASAASVMWTGGLTAAAGVAVLVGDAFQAPTSAGGGQSLLAWAAVLGGGLGLIQGRLRQEKARLAQAKVEKRRRLDKSRAP